MRTVFCGPGVFCTANEFNRESLPVIMAGPVAEATIRGRLYTDAVCNVVPLPVFEEEAVPVRSAVVVLAEEIPGMDFSIPFADAFSIACCVADELPEPEESSCEVTTPVDKTTEGIIAFDPRPFNEDFVPVSTLVTGRPADRAPAPGIFKTDDADSSELFFALDDVEDIASDAPEVAAWSEPYAIAFFTVERLSAGTFFVADWFESACRT